MAKQSLGYVELEWTCPFCNTRNPGRSKVCSNCGAPQPKDVAFQQAAEDKIVTEQAVLETIAAGPDIHCPFCGTRNPGNATKCARCGGDLAQGEKRESGQVLGAQQTGPAAKITCEFCGTENPGTRVTCSNCGSPLAKAPRPEPVASAAVRSSAQVSPVMLIGGGLVLLLICGALAFFLMRGTQTDTYTARVDSVNWKRTIVVLGLVPVQNSAWADQIPPNANINSCRQEARSRSPFPAENSQEICGTPYLVDQGSGFAESVQDCEYIVYDDYCSYTAIQLAPVGMLEESGSDMNPIWPETRLGQDQELGQRQETYQIEFSVDGEDYIYQTKDFNEYRQFAPGSAWDLEINGFGDIVAIEPAQ
jgi:ribosomal protein L40E